MSYCARKDTDHIMTANETDHHTVFNDGQDPYHKASCKGPKINEVKLFINDENRPNQLKKVKRLTMNIKNNNNPWTTGSWLGTAI